MIKTIIVKYARENVAFIVATSQLLQYCIINCGGTCNIIEMRSKKATG